VRRWRRVSQEATPPAAAGTLIDQRPPAARVARARGASGGDEGAAGAEPAGFSTLGFCNLWAGCDACRRSEVQFLSMYPNASPGYIGYTKALILWSECRELLERVILTEFIEKFGLHYWVRVLLLCTRVNASITARAISYAGAADVTARPLRKLVIPDAKSHGRCDYH